MNNFIARTTTGTLLVILLISAIIINQFTLAFLFLIISVAGMLELFKLSRKGHINPQKLTGVILAVSVYLSAFVYVSVIRETKIFLIPLAFTLLIFIVELYRNKKTPAQNIAFTLFGILFIILPLCALIAIGFINSTIYNYHFILSFFILIWIYDTGAYLVGSKIGKNKLFPRISPKKSWEGTIGGILLSLAGAYFISMFFKELILLQWFGFAIVVSVFGTLGDLSESMMKRSWDIKDSGNILPGHGGILDRFDSVFLAAPAIYIYLQLIY